MPEISRVRSVREFSICWESRCASPCHATLACPIAVPQASRSPDKATRKSSSSFFRAIRSTSMSRASSSTLAMVSTAAIPPVVSAGGAACRGAAAASEAALAVASAAANRVITIRSSSRSCELLFFNAAKSEENAASRPECSCVSDEERRASTARRSSRICCIERRSASRAASWESIRRARSSDFCLWASSMAARAPCTSSLKAASTRFNWSSNRSMLSAKVSLASRSRTPSRSSRKRPRERSNVAARS
mmetsp:Transcript_83260/g.240577  ORF Transcript_83260/g.240577 Transcript_83260/m.240577 type:complete len:249 (-) Transcript_83260:422-1168(-)